MRKQETSGASLRVIAVFFLSFIVAGVVACSSTFEEKDLAEISVTLGGEPGNTLFVFNNIAPNTSAAAEISIQNIGSKDLEITGFRFGSIKTDKGEASAGRFVLKNEVADTSSMTVWVDDSRCSDGWTLEENGRAISFAADGDCPVLDGDVVEVEYAMVPNPHMSLDFKGKNEPSEEAPFLLEPKDVNQYKSFDMQVVYSPDNSPEGGDLVLIILSNDPNKPALELLFQVSAPSPVASVYPPSKTFLNAAYECQEFTLSNEGSADLVFYGVQLRNPSNRFSLKDWPNKDDIVTPKGSPLSFKVCYTPIDNELEQNLVDVTTNDPLNPVTSISIAAQPRSGAFEVSHEDMALGFVDFTGIDHGTLEKTIVFYTNTQNECQEAGTSCGGPVKIIDINLDPVEAGQAYSWIMQRVVAADEVTVITDSEHKEEKLQQQTFLYSVPPGQSVQVVVTYDADIFLTGMNASLDIDYGTPTTGTYSLNLFGGDPKPEFDVAPANTRLYYSTTGGATEELSAYIYNNGNGPLTVNSLQVTGKWTETSEDFALVDESQKDGFEVAPFSLTEVPITFSFASGDPEPAGRLNIAYEDPQVGEVPMTIELIGVVDLGVAFPVAVPTASDAPTVGLPVRLSGESSEATPGASVDTYVWFLTAKPANSKVTLNEASPYQDPLQSFIPDAPGDYSFGLVVSNRVNNIDIFSDPAEVTVTVP